MLFKLSMSGLKSKFKDYMVLLFGLIISISVFYMFQTLAMNNDFLESNAIVGPIQFIFNTGSFLLAIITFFYILYANSFLLSLRQKEFGMYMMIGAKRAKITLIMFIETITLGILSLIVGIGLGIGLAQVIGLSLMKQLDFTAGGYSAFYSPSIIITCIFFVTLFILSSILNCIKLTRISVLELVHSDSHTERIQTTGKITSIKAISSIILLAIGYLCLIKVDKLEEVGIVTAMVTITSGTYLLFISFLPFFVKKIKSSKRNEKGLNAFTFAQLNFRINSLTKVLATVAMLVALGAGAISTGMAFKNNISIMLAENNIYDLITHNPTTEEKKLINHIKFNESAQYHYKVDSQFVYYTKDELENNRPYLRERMMEQGKVIRKFTPVSGDLQVGAILDLNKPLEEEREFPEEWVRGLTETIHPPNFYPDHNIKIVNKKMYKDIKGEEGVTFVGITDDFTLYVDEWKEINEIQKNKPKEITFVSKKYQDFNELNGLLSGTIFMGFFLGVAFLAMMASCLMFKILTGASKDIIRYQMLFKIGVRYEVLSKSIYKEIFLVFLFPAIVGIVHVLIGMNLFSTILAEPYFRIWLPIGIFIVIYSIYYYITVQLYKRIVLPKF